MPARARVSEEEAIELVIKFIDHFRDDQLPAWSSKIWKQMSDAIDKKWSADCVYTNVRNDRRQILTKARKKMNVPIETKKSCSLLRSESECSSAECGTDDSESNSVLACDDGTETFDLVIAEDEWVAMKPEDEASDLDASIKRKKPQLKPKVWTNIIAYAFWLQYRLPCAYIFKRASVALSPTEDSYTIKIHGKCKSSSCGNIFYGEAEKLIKEPGVTIQVKTRDTRYSSHAVVKRPLNGLRRKEVKKELKNEKSSVWRKRYAREHMRVGETEPFHLPQKDVLRQAKKESIDDQFGVKKDDGRDLVKTIKNISQTPEYYGFINDVAYDPFFVFYRTPAQMHAYKEYCRANKKTSSIKLDATGGVVKKLNHEDGRRSAHIMLYSIVINFENTTICVEQMLSEQQNEPFIEFWIKKWILRGAPAPNEAVCDFSWALLSALCQAFNGESLKKYIANRFESMKNVCSKKPRPVTFIRIDVAHIMHAVSRWSCFQKGGLREVKEFFLFCVGLLLNCKTLSEFEEVLVLTSVVALQKHDDGTVNINGVKTTKQARQKLEELIARGNISSKIETASRCKSPTKTEIKAENKEKDNKINDDNFDIPSDTGNLLNGWLEQIVMRAKETVKGGKDLNPFYQPMFIESLVKLCRVFPLWSSVGLGYNVLRATSSPVEGYFNDLKTRVFAGTLPLRVDKFIKRHLDDIKGATSLFSSSMITFRDRQAASESEYAQPGGAEKIVDRIGEIDAPDLSEQNLAKQNSFQNSTADPGFSLDVSSNIEIVDFAEELDLSSLKSIENWRNKASEPQHDRSYFHPSDQESDDDLLITESAIAVKEHDESTRETDLSLHDHSYTKSEPLQSVRAQDFTKRPAGADDNNNNCNPAKKGKYLQTFPEIRRRNKLVGSSKKPSLLLNGLLCPQVKINGNSYFLQNTCAFDSLIHILMMAGIDDTRYADFLRNSNNDTLQFVSQLIEEGIKPASFVNRAQLLKKMARVDVLLETKERVISYKLDATTNIANLVQNLLASAPSIRKKIICPNCGTYEDSSVSIAPNHWVIARQGFRALGKALGFHAKLFNVSCTRCNAKTTIMNDAMEHMFIELDIRPTVKSAKGLHCKLEDLPDKLQFEQSDCMDRNYTLVGIVAFLPGHYTAYCRRSSGRWELLNDMSKSIVGHKSSTDIEAHYAVYIRLE